MTYFRLYHFEKGRIRSFDELEARDDAEAIVAAKAMVASERAELWQQGRFVVAFSKADTRA